MRTAHELDLLRRITARLDEHLVTDRPRLEAMVRAEHRGDQRMTELALEQLEQEFARLPEQVLDEVLRAEAKQETRH